jgi:ornithine carbamoyltransferase
MFAFEASAASDLRPPTSGLRRPAPSLSRVEPQSDPFTDPIAPRAISLGGPGTGKLPTFTISARLHGRSVLCDTDLTRDEVGELLETAARLKKMRQSGQPHGYLAGKSLGMIFQHPSTRTRVAFEAGMAQLGGQAIFLGVHDLQIKRGETLADTAQVLSRYVDGIVARVVAHADIEEIAAASTVPVVNGLSDRWHPTQALSDLLTFQEALGGLTGKKVAYLGDGNNMVHSLLLCCAAMGMSVAVASPDGYQPDPEVVNHARWLAATTGAGGEVAVTDDPFAAVAGADAVYTDVHVSMGQSDAATRAVALAPYKVTQKIMAAARPSAVFMHCLPMHRDQEVEAAVADGPRSIIFDQAENRLHLHKALLLHALAAPEA